MASASAYIFGHFANGANDWVEVGDVDCQSVSMSVVKKGAILLLRPHWEEEGYAGISVTY